MDAGPNHGGTTMPDSDNWRDRPACRDQPQELFFGLPDRYGIDRHSPDLLAEARRFCARCEVQPECLDAALAGGPDVFGVWGGTTKREREALRRFIVRAKCPVCAGDRLCPVDGRQVCFDCGLSWPIVRPSAQARANADTAA